MLKNILAGYSGEHRLDPEWLERLPTFLKLIEMNSYMAINAYNQVASQNNLAALPAKHRAMLKRYRYNIEHDLPYIESAYFPWADL